ncbi:hypothetical protein GGI19_000318 [Coemansia pectinata]|uniref:Tubulin-specific chaperone D n=1 Tax=Coemansia pectinata TaxID=1052879 RepID=A0A9W8GZL3_9FUNG|nr:hypothetical protein GGI19_000318 [Coemansia pectinata]
MADDKHEAATGDDVGSAPTFFKEHEAFLTMLDTVAESASATEAWMQASAPADEERTIREMCSILEMYQEQPTCLDPYLERIVNRLMAVIEEYVQAYHESAADISADDTPAEKAHVSAARMNGIFELVYMLCKVRGYKIVLRFFPHSVADVEPVLATLWRHTANLGGSNWTVRYVMLIWLSLLSMVPFDLESIDSGIVNLPPLDASTSSNVQASSASSGKALVDLWVELGQFYLRRPGCDMEGAAVMLARLLSRKDTSTTLQPAFIAWAAHEISDAASGYAGLASGDANSSKKGMAIGSVLRINGALRVLCHLFLAMDSADPLQGQIGPLLDVLQSDAFEQHSVTRKLATKAAQRLALLVLPPLSATKRSDARPSARANLGAGTNTSSLAGNSAPSTIDKNMNNVPCASHDADLEISEEVETCIGVLLQRLHDKDTIVRWSAAKGIGRITERLPRSLAQEIVSAVVGMLQEETLVPATGLIDVSMTSEFSWHGSLLCLAELSRRGLLTPLALRETITWVLRGLTYEIQRGDYSVGSNVRDAACYVMWSFARVSDAAAKSLFAEMSTILATALVSVAVFDREPNVRRAASAAYQEHVGRHSAFPHGISVLQLADFFSVGNMHNAFVVASRRISEFTEYREPLLRHLCTVTIYHWDLKTRELAVEALRELAPLSPEYMASSLLPEMLVLSVAENVPNRFTEDFGASLTLAALATFIGGLSRAGWDIGGDQTRDRYFDYFVRALAMCPKPQSIVIDFTSFVDAYGITPDQHASIVHHVQEGGPGSSREGFVVALGALGTRADFEMLCNLITEGVTVEIRRDAALALGQFSQRALEIGQCGKMCDGDILAAVGALLGGLHDRTVDNRGDVGSWVRHQCLCSLQRLLAADLRVLVNVHGDRDLALRLLGRILHAATEKIDRLRVSAGLLLESFLYGPCGTMSHASGIDRLDADAVVERCIEELRLFIPNGQQNCNREGINWVDSESAYAQLVYALSVSEESLRKLLFEGLVVAGSAEPMGKFAINAVATYAGALPTADKELGPGWTVDGIIAELTRLLLTDKQTSKLINPALIVSDQLIEQGALLAASPDTWIPLYRAVQRVAFKLRAPQRLMLCVKLYGSLSLVSPAVARLVGESLLAHIGHPIPKIRQVAADQLFTMLCINGVVADIDEEGESSLEEIEQLLSETEWMQETDSVKESRARLAELVRQLLRDKSAPR